MFERSQEKVNFSKFILLPLLLLFLTLKFSYIFYRHESCRIGRILFMKLDD